MLSSRMKSLRVKPRKKKEKGSKRPAITKAKYKKPQAEPPTKRVTRASARATGTYSKSFLSRNPHQKFPKGTAVMSRWGPAIVQRVLASGTEAELIWPNYDNPEAVYTTKLEHFWLPEEKPGEEYGSARTDGEDWVHTSR